jgi:hypothetical protein
MSVYLGNRFLVLLALLKGDLKLLLKGGDPFNDALQQRLVFLPQVPFVLAK